MALSLMVNGLLKTVWKRHQCNSWNGHMTQNNAENFIVNWINLQPVFVLYFFLRMFLKMISGSFPVVSLPSTSLLHIFSPHNSLAIRPFCHEKNEITDWQFGFFCLFGWFHFSTDKLTNHHEKKFLNWLKVFHFFVFCLVSFLHWWSTTLTDNMFKLVVSLVSFLHWWNSHSNSNFCVIYKS